MLVCYQPINMNYLYMRCFFAFCKGGNKQPPTGLDHINIKQSYSYWGKRRCSCGQVEHFITWFF